MATRTGKVGNYDWNNSASWVEGAIPVNGDAVVLPTGCVMRLDTDITSFANGLLSMQVDGIFHVKASAVTGLKMNGNITGTGALYIAERLVVTGFTLTTGKTNTYQVARSLDVATVEDTLGAGYLDAVEELVEIAIDVENAARVAQGLNEMMPDAVQTFIETTRASLTLSQILAYVEATAGSFYHDTVNDILYIHTSDSTDPAGKTIAVIEPINRPAAGSEYRHYNLWNSTATIAMTGTPIIRTYGWYPEREWTQLAADAASGQNQVVLTKDLGLQAGDIVSIGSGTEYGISAETAKGIYTVSSYVAATKTVTLTANLQTNRLQKDYIGIISKPIKVSRSSGTTALISTIIHGCVFKGMRATIKIVSNAWSVTTVQNNYKFCHCSSSNAWFVFGLSSNCILKDCIGATGQGYALCDCVDSIAKRCVMINGGISATVLEGDSLSINEISQNTVNVQTASDHVKNSIGINGSFLYPLDSSYKNCIIQAKEDISALGNNYATVNFSDVIFKSNTNGYFTNVGNITLHNCLFEGNIEVYLAPWQVSKRINSKIESFDHNQLPGNYKAWMKGGHIETALDGTTPHPGRLIFHCESANYPVFHDFPVTLVAYRNMWWWASVLKDFTGGTVKMELIDPAEDPLIDPSAVPLASDILEDIKDVLSAVKLNYRSNKNMQAILRVSAQNSTGTVQVNTRLIEQRVKYGR